MLKFPENHKPALGEKLPSPFFEVTTKLEKVDRNLTLPEAVKISNLSLDELNRMKDLAIAIDQEMDSRIAQRGLVHVDGKKEFALDDERNLMVVDTFGTADEDRFWDAKELKAGKFVERSKEFVRQYYREIGYHEKLMKARREGTKEPPIPSLPKDMLESVSRVYIGLYEDLTGQRFR
jgi:phosphoribosylaminoimidazole-succinocarboxamide synthase